MAIDRTTQALETALQLLAAVESSDNFLPVDVEMPGTLMSIRDEVEGALSSIRQQPVQIGGAELAVRLLSEVKNAGSEAELARRIDIKRQSLADVLSGRREAGPAILNHLHLRKVTTVRFEHAMPEPKAEPKPRSERRQRAWDGLPRIQEEASA